MRARLRGRFGRAIQAPGGNHTVMKRVLVTGAAGQLGAIIVRRLVKSGFDVVAADQNYRSDLPVAVTLINFLDRMACYSVTRQIDAVMHLANHPRPHPGREAQIYGENCAINVNVFQAAIDQGVKQIIYASSIQVINGDRYASEDGRVPPSSFPYLPIDGDTPANPRNHYSLSKYVGEQLLEFYAKSRGVSCVALRLPGCWSAHDLTRYAAYRKSKTSSRISAYTPLDEGFAYLAAEDAAVLIEKILLAPRDGFRIYLPAANSLETGMTLAETVQAVYPNVPLRKPIESLRSLVDISRITEETGWTPKFEIGMDWRGLWD